MDSLERLAKLDTGLISDVLDEAGWPMHALDVSLRPVTPGARLVGRAACIRGEAIVAGRHAPTALPGDAIEAIAVPGSIIVISTGGYRDAAPVGGLFCSSLMGQGATGLLTDGAVRDSVELAEMGFPVFSAALSPVNASRRWRFAEADVPVPMPGIGGTTLTVHPGDLILGDNDGVVVIPGRHALQVIEDAEQLKRIEAEIVAAMRSGMTRASAFAAHPRFAHVRLLA